MGAILRSRWLFLRIRRYHMEEQEYWIWLSRIEGLGPIKMKELLEKYQTPKQIWNLTKEELIQTKGIGEKIANQILEGQYRQNLK